MLRQGETCWRVERADRVAFLVDGASYYGALREALLKARRSVFIVGWDVDSRVRLVGEREPDDGFPPTLLPFLNAVLDVRPELHVHVLGWDFSMIYAFEREAMPRYKFGWRGHRRLHFALDNTHPVGASHHQKIVVIDDALAFTGGIDLTIRRWDTPLHNPDDHRRRDPAGVIYAPMHDVQMVFDGQAAAALGELARGRWTAATGVDAARSLDDGYGEDDPEDLWPAVAPDVRDVQLGIARTVSVAPEGMVAEVAALTLAAIQAARKTIFIENQYLTSAAVGEALAARLAEPDGPEVLLILPQVECGWLEQSSMGILRARVMAKLRAADRHGRLAAYHPVVPGLGGHCVNVHSKVLIVDDQFLKIGSSNLSNRSMGLDTECDIALTSSGPHDHDQVVRAVRGFRARLLGEHLGVAPALVERRHAETGSLLQAVASLRGGERSLEPLSCETGEPPTIHLAVLDGLVCDPERPVQVEQIMESFVPVGLARPARRSLLLVVGLVALLGGLAALWRLEPVREVVGFDSLVAMGRGLRDDAAAPLYVIGAYLLGGVVLFPVTLLIAGTAVVFPAWQGFLFALAGTMASSALTYGMGRVIRRGPIQRRWGQRLMRLRRQLQRRGFLGVLAARILPVGNFSVVGILSGTLKIPFGSYMLGSLLGLLPGLIGMCFFADRLINTVKNPGAANFAWLAGALVLLVLMVVWLRRVLGRMMPSLRLARGGEAT